MYWGGGELISLLCDYLCGRKQRVVVGGQISSELTTNSGVPQGSILGPLLFLIFINDIEREVLSEMSLFADDASLAQVYSNSFEAEHALNRDLDTISVWARRWMVEFNFSKMVFINFSLKTKKRGFAFIFLRECSRAGSVS